MENKKLLKFILRDLSEIEELVAEKGANGFDELEMEFLQTRINGAKRMIQILFDNENSTANKTVDIPKNTGIEEKVEAEAETEIEAEAKAEAKTEAKAKAKAKAKTEAEMEEKFEADKREVEGVSGIVENNEVELEEEEIVVKGNQRLGDSFLKEKSVNDLINTEDSKLEYKISNRPVESIKAAIGINDKFQYIRELFEGNAEVFTKVVADLDAKRDINEAVKYLQQNFKWKKNETSLKFVNLVKRRFSNE